MACLQFSQLQGRAAASLLELLDGIHCFAAVQLLLLLLQRRSQAGRVVCSTATATAQQPAIDAAPAAGAAYSCSAAATHSGCGDICASITFTFTRRCANARAAVALVMINAVDSATITAAAAQQL